MAELRQLIDDVDRRLVTLLRERQGCIDRAIVLKPGEAMPARIDSRIAQVIANVRRLAEAEGLDPTLAETLWRDLIDWAIAREEAAFRAGTTTSPEDGGGSR